MEEASFVEKWIVVTTTGFVDQEDKEECYCPGTIYEPSGGHHHPSVIQRGLFHSSKRLEIPFNMIY